IAAIPAIAWLSGEPVSWPWFALLIAAAALYNLTVIYALRRGRRIALLTTGTALVDSLFLLLLCWFSRGIRSAITTYVYLAMVTVCMRLPFVPALAIGAVYATEFAALAWRDGALWSPELPVKICYVFLTVVFVAPLVYEARTRFAEVLAGHQAQRTLLHRLLRTSEDE